MAASAAMKKQEICPKKDNNSDPVGGILAAAVLSEK